MATKGDPEYEGAGDTEYSTKIPSRPSDLYFVSHYSFMYLPPAVISVYDPHEGPHKNALETESS